MEETYQDIVLQWYNKVRPLFVNTLRSRFCELDYDTIEDLYQETFLAVYENLRAGKVRENTSWQSYIIGIGIKRAFKLLRHKTETIYEYDNNDADGQLQISRVVEKILSERVEEESVYNNIEAQGLLGEELNFTPEPCNKIIRLFYYDGMSMEDIATAVNFRNATTAKSKKSQCMKSLTERVKACFKRAEII